MFMCLHIHMLYIYISFEIWPLCVKTVFRT